MVLEWVAALGVDEGQLDLDSIVIQDVVRNSSTWENVVRKIESRQMPLSFAARRCMGKRIYLSSPPTGLDAYSHNTLELPCWVMPLLPPGIN